MGKISCFIRKSKKVIHNNIGMTIMEMLIVMVLIAILSGLVGLTYQYIHNANVQEAGENLAAAIKTARTISMAKGTEKGRLTLYIDGGAMYYTIGDSTAKEKICNQIMDFTIFTSFNTVTNLAPSSKSPDGTQYVLRFTTAGTVCASPNSDFNYVVFYKGDRCYSILAYPETGKVEQTLFFK